MNFFKIQGLTKYFGGLPAVNGLDFHVREKEIMALMGRTEPEKHGFQSDNRLFETHQRPDPFPG